MRLLPAIVICLALAAPRTALAQAAALHTLLHDIFEDELKRSPEFASAIGDLRYNDQLSDLSARAFNDGIAAEQGFLNRLLVIDTAGLSEPDRLAAATILQQLTADLEAARNKPWELPILPSHGIQTDPTALASYLSFATVKDGDDYIARLHLIPRQLRQESENLLAGIDDNRVAPADLIEKALKNAEFQAAQTPKTSFFTQVPRFPASIPAATRMRITTEMLDAIQTDVLPAYARFAKFLRVVELPAAQKEHPAISIVPLTTQASQTHVLELRDHASGILGDKFFDIKTFHDLIFSSFGLPSDALDKRVSSWMADRKRVNSE